MFALKEVLGEALVAVYQECSLSLMTSGTETFLRSRTAVGRQGWNTNSLSLTALSVQLSEEQAGEARDNPSTGPTPNLQELGSFYRSLNPLRKTKSFHSCPGNQRRCSKSPFNKSVNSLANRPNESIGIIYTQLPGLKLAAYFK